MSNKVLQQNSPSEVVNKNLFWRVDHLLAGLALALVLLCLIVLGLKASYLSPGFLSEPNEGPLGWRITKVLKASEPLTPEVDQSWVGKVVTKACSQANPQRCIDLKSEWMIDTPIRLSTASAQRAFAIQQQALFALGDAVILHRADGPQAAVQLKAASTHHFDELIATQVLAVVLFYTMGCAMLAFVRRTPEVWIAFVMCAGYSIFVLCRIWYTNRSWAQPEDSWWVVFIAFKVGVLMCACGALIVLWRLRLRERFKGILLGIIAAICAVNVLHLAGWIDSVFWGYRLPTLLCLLAIIGSGVYSSFRATTLPLENAAQALESKNFARLIAMGFIPALVTNATWAFRPDLTQIALLNNFAVASGGIPVVILVARSSEYGLQKFWWTLWLVLIGSTIAIVGAGFLALVSGLSTSIALIIAATAASWIVYLQRLWLSKKLLGETVSLKNMLPKLMALSGVGVDQASTAWHRVLVEAFEPHSSRIIQWPLRQAQMQNQGNELVVPDLQGNKGLCLQGAANFTRSFNQSDVELANTLLTLAAQGLDARDSYALGALQERQRIAADLHDDIGGKLLHLANAPGGEGQYARNTLEDLRTITRGLSAEPKSLAELLADLRYQLAQRADRHGIDLVWSAELGAVGDQLISSHQSTVLASIASELLRNAMQHKPASRIEFDLKIVQGTVYWRVVNDGAVIDPSQWPSGLGMTSIRRRIHDLQGYCNWAASNDSSDSKLGGVSFTAQWPLEAMMR